MRKHAAIWLLRVLKRLLGARCTLGNPDRLFLEGLAYVLALFAGQVDFAGRQSLVAYAEKGHLDHLGMESDTPRLGMLPATTTLRFSLAGPLGWSVEVLGGTRVSTQDRKVVFITDAYAEIPAGELYVDIPATAMSAGAAANGLVPGQVNAHGGHLPVHRLRSQYCTYRIRSGSGGRRQLSAADIWRARIIHLRWPARSVRGPRQTRSQGYCGCRSLFSHTGYGRYLPHHAQRCAGLSDNGLEATRRR